MTLRVQTQFGLVKNPRARHCHWKIISFCQFKNDIIALEFLTNRFHMFQNFVLDKTLLEMKSVIRPYSIYSTDTFTKQMQGHQGHRTYVLLHLIF